MSKGIRQVGQVGYSSIAFVTTQNRICCPGSNFCVGGDPLGTAGSALLAVFVVDMADSSTTELANKEFCVVLRLVCGAVEQDNIAGRWRQL
jgi:hypothetical protein